MSDERSEAAGAAGGGDAGSDVTPDEGPRADEEDAAEQDNTAMPIGVPVPPENWRELKRRADDPGDASPDQSDDSPD
jgi:hypothetical protein